jgi:MerR family mercuric resistance operon transcriptional regulator
MSETYTLAEAARLAGLTAHHVRIYASMGLVEACATTASGYRLFDARCLERLKLIKTCRDAQLGLAEIAQFLRALDGDDPALRRAAERELRTRLHAQRLALARCVRVLTEAMAL